MKSYLIQGCIEGLNSLTNSIKDLEIKHYIFFEKGISSIGEHTRHCLEHFFCFMEKSTKLDYSLRRRDKDIEKNKDLAIKKIKEIINYLENIKGDESLIVKDFTSKAGKKEEFNSSERRELLFLSSHTLHHITIINLILKNLSLFVDEENQLAFSTLNHIQSD